MVVAHMRHQQQQATFVQAVSSVKEAMHSQTESLMLT